jgi:hypothetical protein
MDQSIEDASRKEFEVWIVQGCEYHETQFRMLETFPNGDYKNTYAYTSWKAWKAARQSSQSETVAITKEVFEIIGYLVSMASIYDEAHAKHYASKLDSLLSIAAPQQAIPSGLIETLKFYANKANYKTSWDSDSNHVMEDKGEIARNALAAYESAAPTAPIESNK